MPDQKYDMSPRALRRVLLGWVLGLVILVVAAAVWVVNPGQKAVVIGWSVLAAVLLVFVFRVIPDSPVRPVRHTVDRPLREAFRFWPYYVAPGLLGQLTSRLVPADPSNGVETGVFVGAMSAGVGMTVLIGIWRSRRRFTAR